MAVVGFVFPHAMQATLEEYVTDRIIHSYRDDEDLQNLIDFAQQQVKCIISVIIRRIYNDSSPFRFSMHITRLKENTCMELSSSLIGTDAQCHALMNSDLIK